MLLDILLMKNPVTDWQIHANVFLILLMVKCAIDEFSWRNLLKVSFVSVMFYFLPIIICGSFALVFFGYIWQTSILLSDGYENDGTVSIDPRHTVVETTGNGTIVGYRYFRKLPDGTYLSITKNGVLADGGIYRNKFKRSHRMPTLKNEVGIYAAKTIDSPILKDYKGEGFHLVRVELSGRVVTSKHGYRARECKITEDYGVQ